MTPTRSLKLGYVVKRYPRFSETFIVSEILAHEAAGAQVLIYALRPSFDPHFQDRLAKVRAPVTYLGFDNIRTADFWSYLTQAAREFPHLGRVLLPGDGETANEACQGVALARAARAAGVDHLHAHFATSATTVTRVAARLAELPYTFTAHAKDIYHDSVDAAGFRRKLSDAAACITVSDFNARFLQRRYDAASATIVRVYNGLELAELPYASPRERPPLIVAVGRLVEKKGFTHLIDACALLRSRGERFTCRITGDGPLESALRSQIDRQALGDAVTLLGARPQSDVVREIQSAAVVALPCIVAADGDRDGLPTVMLEAMALGTPCVATPVTGIPEALVDDRSGLLVPERDAEALASALATLLSDAERRVRVSEAARRHVESEFDVHRSAARLRELFARGRGERELRTA